MTRRAVWTTVAIVIVTAWPGGAQQPGPSRVYYRKELKQLVYQAIVD